MGADNSDIDSLTERAKVIAKETGREEADILQDLLDDGIINESNKPESLVDQLKDAAELIATVQDISKGIEQNTVLNGGKNKTEIKVESTIEGDIVDRAIESVQRKADKLKKLAATIIPILLLLAGGGAESMGWVNFLEGWGEDNEDEYYITMGCMDEYALNYNDMANEDDGTCEYEFEPCDDDDGDGTCNYDEIGGCTDTAATNYNYEATDDDGSCEYEEPEDDCIGSFYSGEVKLETVNNTTDMKIYWDADWSCDVEQYIEVDIYIKWSENQTQYGGQSYAGYNTTGDESDIKVFTNTNMPNGTYDVCLTLWVEISDTWRNDAEWIGENITI